MFLAPDRLVPVDELGIRLLVADRPGYGASTRLPGRSIASVADDVAVLADSLGWDRFALWGASGGGPHALGCAARMGDRIMRCAGVVSPAPFDACPYPSGMGQTMPCALARTLTGSLSTYLAPRPGNWPAGTSLT
jgi:pimeloyl-ACP methyl ester carboxylesterase